MKQPVVTRGKYGLASRGVQGLPEGYRLRAMRWLVRLMLLLPWPWAGWAQESGGPCREGALTWHSCFGVEHISGQSRYVGEFLDNQYDGLGRLIFPEGGEYIGQFRNGKPEGLGLEYRPNGALRGQGEWIGGRLAKFFKVDPIALIQSRLTTPADRQLARALAERKVEGLPQRREPKQGNDKQLEEALDSIAQQGLPWVGQIQQFLQTELLRWLSLELDGLGPVPAPRYPPSVSALQEVWETNREFEQRVELAREARRLAVKKIKAEHIAAVNRRNERVNEYNVLVSERWPKAGRYRRALIDYALSRSLPPVKVNAVTLDRQSGHLHISAEVAGLAPQDFVLTETQQSFRRIALTQAQSLKVQPGFELTEEGELVLRSILVEAEGVTVQGTVAAQTTSAGAKIALPEVKPQAPIDEQVVVFDPDEGAKEEVVFRDRN